MAGDLGLLMAAHSAVTTVGCLDEHLVEQMDSHSAEYSVDMTVVRLAEGLVA